MRRSKSHQKKPPYDFGQKANLLLTSRPKFIVTTLSLVLFATTMLPLPAHANIFDPLLKVLLPFYDGGGKDKQNNSESFPEEFADNKPNTAKIENKTKLTITNKPANSEIFSSNGNASDILNLSESVELNLPSLYKLLDAEFSYDRGDVDKALTLYKQQSFNKNATAVFERALNLSLEHENIQESLAFASQWYEKNPNHVPAWFYVAHLALQAHDYELAGDTLSRILQYDPKADFSQILQGIYPTNEADQRKLLVTLQQLNSEQNSTLSVLQAGLLLQTNKPYIALTHINRALKIQENNIPFITLKADILQQLGQSEELFILLASARKNWLKNHQVLLNKNNMAEGNEAYQDNAEFSNSDTMINTTLDDNEDNAKELYLYEVRYRLQQQSQDTDSTKKAWQLLIEANNQFSDDPEITLLASLVSLDVQEYTIGDQLLITLIDRPAYENQAYFYLATSAERQHNHAKAKHYYALVEQDGLILAARKKVVAYELLDGNIDEAINSLIDLRDNYPEYVTESYILQADILNQQGNIEQAKNLLNKANQEHPNDSKLQFAHVNLLDNLLDYRQKYETFTKLRDAEPDNLAYQLEFATLLLSKAETQQQAITLIQQVVNMPSSDERFDSNLYWQGLNLLASTALDNKEYQQVIDYLEIPYKLLPTLPTGVLLLKTYQGMGDTGKINQLQTDMQQRFGYLNLEQEAKVERETKTETKP